MLVLLIDLVEEMLHIPTGMRATVLRLSSLRKVFVSLYIVVVSKYEIGRAAIGPIHLRLVVSC